MTDKQPETPAEAREGQPFSASPGSAIKPTACKFTPPPPRDRRKMMLGLSSEQLREIKKKAEWVEAKWLPNATPSLAWAVGFMMGRGYDAEALEMVGDGWGFPVQSPNDQAQPRGGRPRRGQRKGLNDETKLSTKP